jgi:serine/threonine protein kinase
MKQKDAEEVWNAEVATLDSVTGLQHDHLIQRIAAIKRGSRRYLMFPWAEDGNLRNFWVKDPKPNLTADFIKAIIVQLRGMADGILKLHIYSGQLHTRHGDIKPENILIFPDKERSRIGTFKIADFGAAKNHNQPTALRNLTAGKAFATMVYQPPEAVTNPLSATSRRYDIWSMGCVTLEFIVWLLYGYEGLRDFNASIIGDQGKHSSFFVSRKVEQPDNTPGWLVDIHPAVETCLEELAKDQECSGKTALRGLLDVIRTKLLVIALNEQIISPPEFTNVQVTDIDATSNIQQPSGKIRATAAEFVQALDRILQHKNSNDDSYWFTGQSRRNIRLPSTISRSVTKDSPSQQGGLSVPEKKQHSGLMVDRTNILSAPDVPVSPVFLPGQAQNVSTISCINILQNSSFMVS